MINKETAKVQYTTVADQSTWYAVDFEYFTTPATGLPQLKVLLDGQELTANKDYITGPQGIQLVVAPTAGVSLVIERDVPFTQEIDFQMGLIDPEKIERGLDESVMRDQELATGISDLNAKHDSLAEEVEEVRTVAEGAAADAASAVQTATDAASAANSASEKADEAKTAADNADSKAQEALDLANSYDTRITTAQNTADSAKTTADSAKTTADQALAGLDGKQDKGDYATKTELSQGLADKQDKGDYATKTELTQGLAGKADTSVTDALRNDVDGLGDQVSGVEEKIPADASSSNQLATKADLSNIDALPSQAGNEGKFLTTDGTNASWAEINQGGAVSSVNGQTGAVVLSAEDVGAVEKNQGSENAGKFLKVGADGQVIASAESGGGGLAAVAHDATLEGDGTDGNPLKLSTSTAAEISAAQSTADKADNAAEVAQQTANLAGQEAAQALSALAGKVNIAQGSDNAGKVMTVGADGNLAPADAPSTTVTTDATLDGTGTADSPLGVAQSVQDSIDGKLPLAGGEFTSGATVVLPGTLQLVNETSPNQHWNITAEDGVCLYFTGSALDRGFSVNAHAITPKNTTSMDLGSDVNSFDIAYIHGINNGADIAIPTTGGTMALLSDIPDVSEFQTASQVTTIADTQANAAINNRFLVVDALPAEPDANTFYFIKKA